MEVTTYKVTFKETADEWIFQYRKADGFIYQFTNIKGVRIANLLAKSQFPINVNSMEEWRKFKQLVTIELMIEDYSFENFWNIYNLKLKRQQAEKAYNKLTLVDKILCFVNLPKYDAHLQKTGQAKAHLITWINQKRYNDEY